jgi:hypothetical protein
MVIEEIGDRCSEGIILRPTTALSVEDQEASATRLRLYGACSLVCPPEATSNFRRLRGSYQDKF